MIWKLAYTCCIQCLWRQQAEDTDDEANNNHEDTTCISTSLLAQTGGIQTEDGEKNHVVEKTHDNHKNDKVYYVYEDGASLLSSASVSSSSSSQSSVVRVNRNLPWWAKRQRRWDRFGMTFFEPVMEGGC